MSYERDSFGLFSKSSPKKIGSGPPSTQISIIHFCNQRLINSTKWQQRKTFPLCSFGTWNEMDFGFGDGHFINFAKNGLNAKTNKFNVGIQDPNKYFWNYISDRSNPQRRRSWLIDSLTKTVPPIKLIFPSNIVKHKHNNKTKRQRKRW